MLLRAMSGGSARHQDGGSGPASARGRSRSPDDRGRGRSGSPDDQGRAGSHFQRSDTARVYGCSSQVSGRVNVYGELEGRGNVQMDNGEKHVGQFQAGRLRTGTITLPDGTTFSTSNRSKSFFQHGVLKGAGFINWDGTTYEGDVNDAASIRDVVPHGYGTMKEANGFKYQGYFKNGERHGFGTLYWPRSPQSPERYLEAYHWRGNLANGACKYRSQYYDWTGTIQCNVPIGHGALERRQGVTASQRRLFVRMWGDSTFHDACLVWQHPAPVEVLYQMITPATAAGYAQQSFTIEALQAAYNDQATTVASLRKEVGDLRAQQEDVNELTKQLDKARAKQKALDAWEPLLSDPIKKAVLVSKAVISKYGTTYSEDSITQWLLEKQKDPMNNMSLHADELRPNSLARQVINIVVAIEEAAAAEQAGGQASASCAEQLKTICAILKCPISEEREMMREPVLASDNTTYEKESLEKLLTHSADPIFSPIDGTILDRTVMIPNRIIKDLIEECQRRLADMPSAKHHEPGGEGPLGGCGK